MPSVYTQISDYDTLKEEVQSYLNRNDTTTINKIPLFINNAEKSLKRQLRMPAIERTIEFTSTDFEGDDWFYLPSDYLEMKNFWYTIGDVSDHMYPVDMVQMVRMSGNAPPTAYARSSSRIYVGSLGEEEIKFTMTYYVDLPETGSYIYDSAGEVVGVVETSVLYDIAHDVLLFMSVAEGFRFLYEIEQAEYWKTQGEARIAEIENMVYEAEYSGGIIQVGAGLVASPVQYDITQY